ncbi:HNH endonuclease protein [Rhizobium phage RHph_X2_25]|nr:HNH endonuclease protein [Rhizobium phage RHph_X2_25]
MDAANDNRLPRTRAEALEIGAKHFFTGEPCSRGHVAKRYASTGQCHACQYEHRIRWRTENPEKERETRIQSLRKWTANNPELKREYARRSNAKPEVSANNVARAKRWQEANPERAQEVRLVSDRNRRARKRGASGTHTKEDVAEILRKQKYKCAECGTSVRKVENRHVDHIMPLSKGGSNAKWNLQVLCPDCNLRKGAKHPIDFARERGRLV